MKTTLRLLLGLTLLLPVAGCNSVAGYGYLLIGELDLVFGALADPGDPRWVREQTAEGERVTARDEAAVLTLLWASTGGRYGLVLLVVATLQGAAGVVLLVRSGWGRPTAFALTAIGAAGIAVELVGALLKSGGWWMNAAGAAVSLALVVIASSLRRRPA